MTITPDDMKQGWTVRMLKDRIRISNYFHKFEKWTGK